MTPDERPYARAAAADLARLPLRAHELLRDVPLHDVWQVDLPGGADRTLADVRRLMDLEALARSNPAVRALFGLRRWLGRVFGWDAEGAARPVAHGPGSYLGRLSARDRATSLVPPGTRENGFTVLYVRDHEAASEIRNATVHAFSVLALAPRPGGLRLFWAIYVAPVGRVTAAYMALIDPFRRLLIYPAVLRHLHRTWRDEFGRTPS